MDNLQTPESLQAHIEQTAEGHRRWCPSWRALVESGSDGPVACACLGCWFSCLTTVELDHALAWGLILPP
jgi:hypothetical protein